MVPNGWSVVKLGDVLTLGSGDTKPTDLQKEFSDDSPYPVYGGNNIMGYSSQKNSSDSVILIGRVGEYCGVTRYIDKACWITDNALYTKSVSSDIDKEYLVSKLKKFDLSRLRNKGGQPLVSQKPIYAVKLPMPPLPEQRKIAKILSTWDKAISTTEKLIETSKQQKKALMQQLLTGKKRLVNPETGKAFEGEWEETSLATWLLEYKEKSLVQDQYRVFTSSRSGLVPQDEYFGNSRIADRKNIGFHVLPPNHMTYRSRSDDGFFTFNLFKQSENGIISHYYPVFTSKGANEFFIALFEQYRGVFGKHSVGTSQKVLSFNALKSIKFKIPNVAEQQKIALVLTAADKEIEVLEAKLTHFKQEKKALMQQLLTGKKRVVI